MPGSFFYPGLKSGAGILSMPARQKAGQGAFSSNIIQLQDEISNTALPRALAEILRSVKKVPQARRMPSMGIYHLVIGTHRKESGRHSRYFLRQEGKNK